MESKQTPVAGQDNNAGAVGIGLGAQYVKDLSFEAPNSPQVFAPNEATPEISVNVNVGTQAFSEGAFEVALNIKAEAKASGKVAYIVDLTYAGVFVLPSMPTEQTKMFLLVEGPRLLFPFARAIIANAVRDGGFAPLVLNPVDFMSLYMANRGNVGTMPPAGAA